MAKRRRRSKAGAKPRRFARRSLPRVDITELEDRRRWHPEPYFRPARSVRPPTRLAVGEPSRAAPLFSVPTNIHFKRPTGVLICQRRSTRREVLFAYQRAPGRGLGRNKKRRTNEFSDISCRKV